MENLLEALVICSTCLVIALFVCNIVMDRLNKTSISTEKFLIISGAVILSVFLLSVSMACVFLF